MKMLMASLFYKFIYNKNVNYILRNINKGINSILNLGIKIPPSGIMNLKTKKGVIKLETNQTSYLTQLLFWNGYQSFEYSAIFEAMAKNIDCFFDIGSNIGYYSLLAANNNPHLKAYAFEPAFGPKFYLKKNIELNGFEKQILNIDIALSDSEGVIDFYQVQNKKYRYLEHNLAGEGNTGTKKTSRNFEKISVKTTTLQKFCEDNKVVKIDLIKIDTEGTEHLILSKGKNIIEAHRPIVICETLFNTNEKELESFFGGLGYSFYNHTNKGLMEVKSIRRQIDDKIRNCFFVHPDKIHLIKDFTIH